MIIGKFEGALQLCPTNLVVFFMKTPFHLSACFLSLILCAAALLGQSQNFEVKWSEERTSSKITASELIGRDHDGFFVYRQNRADDGFLILDYYTYDGYQQIRSVEVPLPAVGNRSTRLEKIFLLDDHFLLFTSYFDKQNDLNRAFASLLNKQGEVIKTMFEVDRIEDVTNKKNTGNFAFKLSPDSNFVLAFHDTPFRKMENARFSVKLFDTQLNLLWQKKFKMPYADQDFEVVTALVDNSESVFMVCRLFGQGVFQTQEMRANKKYTLFHYNHRQRKLTEYEINVDNKWIHSARFQLLNDSTLVAGGLYSGTGQGNLAGAFYIRFNTRTGELVSHGFEALPRDVVKEIGYNDNLLFGGLSAFELRKMLLREDGSAVLVMEKDYVSSSTHFDPYTGQRITTYYYHHDDVLALSMSPEGTIEWTSVLPKMQSSSSIDDRYSSIGVHASGGNVYVIFNDHSANLTTQREPGETRTVSNFSKSVAMMAKINRQGKLTLEPLFGTEEFNTILRPKFTNEVASGRQLIYGEQNGKDKFGEIFYPQH